MGRNTIFRPMFLFFLCVFFGSNLFAVEKKRPHIVLISVDTLRADYLGCYGFPNGISPNIDALASEGTLFENTITTIGKTGPAFSSLFASHYPATTGARRNGMRLRQDMKTLTEYLHEQSYLTMAVISNWTLKNRLCGLAKGFDYYNEDVPEVRQGPMAKEKDAEDVTRQGFELLDQPIDRPVFLWIHYSEPHSPYELHQDFEVDLPSENFRLPGWKKRSRYASEVKYTDHWIGRFIEKAKKVFPADNTYFIFISDHGESLGEHSYWGHGKHVYQPNLHIPLLIVGPGFEPNTRVSIPLSILDIMPTILHVANIEIPDGLMGQNIVAGMKNAHLFKDRIRYAFADRGLKVMFHQVRHYEDPLAICMLKNGMKLIYRMKENSQEMFNLLRDPKENYPLSQTDEDNFHADFLSLREWYRALPKYQEKESPTVSNADMEKLKSLGYIE